jgi:CheY-like chemotaxis protein
MSKPHLILVVDDDHEDVDLLREVLFEIDSSIRFLTAVNGKQALEVLHHCKVLPDFIFMDLNMPCMDGKQCLARIRETPQWKHIPVIMCSTSKALRDIEETKNLGAAYFLTKPTSFDAFKTAITYIISANHTIPELSRELKKNLVVLS